MQSFWGLCSRNSRARNALGSTGTASLALRKRNSPLSNLYTRETRDRFRSARHNVACNFLRPTFREPLSAFRKGPLLLAEV
jgi:hypothetical protein